MRPRIPTFVLTLALLAAPAGTALAQNQEATRAYFSPNGGGAAATAAAIRAAQQTIDVAMYSIHTNDESSSRPNPIFIELRKAVERGVRVRFILHQGHTGNKLKAKALERIGVHVFSVTRTLHQKFAVIDAEGPAPVLLNGSANWSISADTTYSENTVVFARHPHLIRQFQGEFNALLGIARPLSPGAGNQVQPVNLPALPAGPAPTESALFTSANILGNASSTNGVVTDALIRAIDSARRSIVVDVAHFDLEPIARALLKVKQQRPWVRQEILLDMGELDNRLAKRVEAAGIPVRYKVYSLAYLQAQSQLMHHKTLIVDEERLITGSFNYSKTAEFKNFENVIDVSGAGNAGLVRAFLAEHRKLWEIGRELYPRLVDALRAQPGSPNYRRVLPVHWNTSYFSAVMTLSREEIDVYYWDQVVDRGITQDRNVSYWDRVTNKPYRPAPGENLGRFLEPAANAPANTPGLSGTVGPQ